MKSYRNDPREITAKFDCRCASTGQEIRKGEICIYYPSDRRVFHTDSKQASDFRSWAFDTQVLGCNYQEYKMRTIINGKAYDTTTAIKLADYDNGYFPNDFNAYRERLYKKKTGEYFLYGEGGALSLYAECRGDGRCGGSKVSPLSEEAAKKWVERKLPEEYESIFGEVEEQFQAQPSILVIGCQY